MKKLFKELHIWLSLPFGIVMAITSFTGAALIFEKEITESLQSHYYFVEPTADGAIPLDELIANIETELQPEQRVTGVVVSPDPERSYKVNLSEPRRAAIYVNQYTGESLGQPERLEFFAVMFRLHRWLMDERPTDNDAIFWGKLIVGISTLAMVAVLLSGIVIWIPKTIKALKNRSQISLRKGWHRFGYDLHVAGGIYAVLLLLIMALTGLTWSFEWYNKGLYRVFGAEQQAEDASGSGNRSATERRASAKSDVAASPYAMWQDVYEEVVALNGTSSQITISAGVASVALDQIGNQRAADKYHFDSATGEITSVDHYSDADRRTKLRGLIYSLHVGNWGGIVTRVLWFLAALLGATLPITGYYLWIRRKFFRKRKE